MTPVWIHFHKPSHHRSIFLNYRGIKVILSMSRSEDRKVRRTSENSHYAVEIKIKQIEGNQQENYAAHTLVLYAYLQLRMIPL